MNCPICAWTPAFLVRMPKTKPIVPQLAEAANPAATLRYVRDGLKLANGEALMLMPLVIDGK